MSPDVFRAGVQSMEDDDPRVWPDISAKDVWTGAAAPMEAGRGPTRTLGPIINPGTNLSSAQTPFGKERGHTQEEFEIQANQHHNYPPSHDQDHTTL